MKILTFDLEKNKTNYYDEMYLNFQLHTKFGNSNSITMNFVLRPEHPHINHEKPELFTSKVLSLLRHLASELHLGSNYITYLLLKISKSDNTTSFLGAYMNFSAHEWSSHINYHSRMLGSEWLHKMIAIILTSYHNVLCLP